MNKFFLVMGSVILAGVCTQPLRSQQSAGAARKPAAAAKHWTVPRTADGKPDLQGFWTNVTVTPLERPANLADKEFLSAEDAVALEVNGNRDDNRRSAGGGRGGGAAGPGGVGDYNALWYDQGKKVLPNRRTSIVTEPKEGKIPALTADAQAKIKENRDYAAQHPLDGPEDLDTIERCITWISSGPPMLPTFYNNNYQIVQTPDYIAILVEMVHDVRIIPIDGKPHSDPKIRQWMGDSRGHWEGDTLVVETTNFNGKRAFLGGGRTSEGSPAVGGNPATGNGGRSGGGRTDQQMKVIERFTRTEKDTLMYQFTVIDPGTYVKPWSGEIPMQAMEGPIYEYACHEGNIAMFDILGGARKAEAEAKKSGK
jgi:hypothetical protein